MRAISLSRVAMFWAACLLGAAQAPPASAHAFFERAEPRVGSVVEASPPVVQIWFDAQIEPAFSTIAVVDATQRRVDRADGRVDAHDPMRLEVGLPRLPDGTYTVLWNNVALDGHPNEGRFTFTIKTKPPSGRSSP